MTDPADNLKPATPDDLASALAFALRFQGRKRAHNADEIMAEIVAERLVDHLERAGFVVMKRPPIGGGAAGADSRANAKIRDSLTFATVCSARSSSGFQPALRRFLQGPFRRPWQRPARPQPLWLR